MRKNDQGSALLIAIIAVLVATIIGVGMVRFAGREVIGAYAGAREQSLVACADAARLQLISQFHALGFQPSQVQALNVPLGSTSGTSLTTAVGGHYDSAPGDIVIDQVTYLPDSAFGPPTAVRNLSNVSSLIGQGGRPLKIVVHCEDGPAGSRRQLEVEFGIRFGL